MSPHPTRKQLAFSLAGLALAPVVTLYATQVVWLESLWAPLPWMATHGKAVGLFWLPFLQPQLHPLRPVPPPVSPPACRRWRCSWGWPSPAGIR